LRNIVVAAAIRADVRCSAIIILIALFIINLCLPLTIVYESNSCHPHLSKST